jgi:hypothetical protein
MRLTFVIAACALASVCGNSPGVVSADQANLPETTGTPADLVRAALKSELGGPSELRRSLLDEAIQLDPNFTPARWHSGFVLWNGHWLTVGEVATAMQSDPQLTAYSQRREGMVNTADNHRLLATWCRKNRLPDQATIHWAKVLEFEPNDAEAIGALGLQWYEGRLMTRQQVTRTKKLRGEQQAANQFWHPKIVKWRAAFAHGNQSRRKAALDELSALSDPAAIPALESTFATSGDSRLGTELNQLLIETVGRMAHPVATETLLRLAVVSESAQTRTAAAAELKKRPMFTYVPRLIAAFPDSITTESSNQVYFNPDGTVTSQVEILQKGRNAEFYFAHVLNANVRFISHVKHIDQQLIDPELAVAARHVATSQAIVQSAQQQEEQRSQLRQRLRSVLRQTTGFADSDDPKIWETQWDDHNGTYYSEFMNNQPFRQYSIYGADAVVNVIRISCFPEGTPVLTVSGSMPIEKIRSGDLILAQDVQTGELSYKTVQNVTLRPPSKLVEIGIDSEKIRATRGHPFWVNGQGWLMAKQLKVGDILHTLNGATRIESIEEAPPSEAYNLVVTGFNTYFVGNQQILVHDNLPLEETSAIVPGLHAGSDLRADE